jgi:hypothetical protein
VSQILAISRFQVGGNENALLNFVGNFTFENNDHSAGMLGVGPPNLNPRHENDGPSTNETLDERTATGRSSETETLERSMSKDEIEEKRRDDEVLKLARKYTSQSHHSIYNKNPFEEKEDSILNPASPNFSPRAFAKSLLNLQARDPEKWKQRTTGFAFKDLNVYGFGSATDYQKSVVCDEIPYFRI